LASNGWHHRFACSTGLLLLAIGSVAAQDPDFSGRWVLVSPAAAAPDTPHAMSVRQTMTRTNIRGEPVKPFVSALTIEREFPGGTQAPHRPRFRRAAPWTAEAVRLSGAICAVPGRAASDKAFR
jgi:hypothetical protein